ncbi:hypothetical protein [Methanorbis furvi]|uniref:hypothetical protein n=1 Tax=Methanorbis furvi TaxID=3028299 RepID=UPI0030B88A68
MTLSYKQFCLLWGKGLLVAAIIAAVAGLLLGDGDWVIVLYQGAAILLVLAVVFLVIGRMMKELHE